MTRLDQKHVGYERRRGRGLECLDRGESVWAYQPILPPPAQYRSLSPAVPVWRIISLWSLYTGGCDHWAGERGVSTLRTAAALDWRDIADPGSRSGESGRGARSAETLSKAALLIK